MTGDPSGPPIRVIVVDDHDLLREGVTACLDDFGDITVVGAADSGEAAVELALDLHPEVVVMDLVMPGCGGVEAIRQITAKAPDIRILALTNFTEARLVRSALEAGATGLQLKSVSGDHLAASIRMTAAGMTALDATVTRAIASTRDVFGDLTPRERDVAELVARGITNADIAAELSISVYTVKNHVSSILAKFQVPSRPELISLILNDRLRDVGGSPPGGSNRGR